MRIECGRKVLSVIVRFMFGRLLTTQSNVHKFLLALKRFPTHFLIRMPKSGALWLLPLSRYSKNIPVHYILTSILIIPNLRVFHIHSIHYSKERKVVYVIFIHNTKILLPLTFDEQTDKKRYASTGNRTHDQDWFT